MMDINCSMNRLFDVKKDQLEKFLRGDISDSFIGDQGSIIHAEDLSYISEGHNASVWNCSLDSQKYAFKIFFEKGLNNSLSYEVYQKMKNLPLKTMVKALEMFKVQQTDKDLFNDAYLMNLLVPNPELSLLEMSTDMLISNIKALQDDAEILSEEHIIMKDVRYENSMFVEEDKMLHLMDIDMFQYNAGVSKEPALKHNYSMLLYLVKQHLQREINESCDFNTVQQEASGRRIVQAFSTVSLLECPPAMKAELAFSSDDSPKQYFLKR